MPASRERLRSLTTELMLIPGLGGHGGRVRRRLAAQLRAPGLAPRTDVLGNLIATAAGDPALLAAAIPRIDAVFSPDRDGDIA